MVSVHYVGDEREPVITMNHATGIADLLVDYAATRSRFAPAASVGSGYPGLLGPAPTQYIDRMVQQVLPLIAEHFGTGPVRPVRARGNFSLVTTDPADLAPAQCVPHVDTADRLQFATVHYLCDARHGGTGFFRHRATGFETVDSSRIAPYQDRRDAELTEGPPRYPGAVDDPLFDLIHACAAMPDRLILYRAALLHSGLIDTVAVDAADPRRGRLTGNLFLQCRLVA
ncbi:DUF6445 family protein [Sphingomonas sp. Leaf38]|jgi:hypothetical protein|uniref:DUF6445 family protein n=1 Tax=Sphingomonas sp. Leaf38 TaxID=1736217 RepID=UPI0006F5DE08|nr:DUF6445 family protein [Sphingomonas sp. Leaf38]KQN29366.1 hypothetical protein ASE88_10530 [Sphingomonas sp. Leaf38]